MADALMETPSYDLAAEDLKCHPGCAALIHDRYIPSAYDLDQLLAYPQNTLGYSYASTLETTGLDPNLHAGMGAESDAQYVELRLSQTHDIWHIVTGFDTSVMGEIGLQAFHLSQFPYPLATMLIANSLISTTLLTPQELPQLLEAIALGWQMGKTAKPLLSQKREEGWDQTLVQWQTALHLQPIQQWEYPFSDQDNVIVCAKT
ncbi:MAG: ubiquinone biosynthesis protein [Oscillatoriales cyanobacterium RM2_1_1]|nr:ubiquinone biosynthesis protein [Oscillatoriales cyanobacterium RM2_1_1]